MAIVIDRGYPGAGVDNSSEWDRRPTFECDPTDQTAAVILITLGAMGIGANMALMAVILLRKPLRR